MNNLVAAPVLLPMVAGTLLLCLHGRLAAQRALSMAAAAAAVGLSGYLAYTVWQGGIQVVQAGGWPAPHGITLAADLFAALMLILAAINQFTTLLFAFRDLDEQRQRTFFYPVLQFLLAGINLSFVTGDLFNLFVAFEVMLISSYFLLSWGGEAGQLREGFKYLMINATGSTLFLVAVALIYGTTGTLNMAELAVRVGQQAGHPVLTLAGILLMLVFGIKAALVPLYFWLPRSYFYTPAAVAALFAGMLTKVGVYSLTRVFTLIFVHDTAYTHSILLVISGLTMFFGVLGAISQMDFKAVLSFHIVSQIGYMIMGLGLYTRLALAGTVFYIAHHIIVKSALFLLSGVTQRITGTTDLKKFTGLIASHPGLAFTFLATGISLAGVPPFSGFFSKFALLRAGVEAGSWAIVTVSLVVSVLTLHSMIKIYRYGFWGEQSGERRADTPGGYAAVLAAPLLLLGLSVAMGLGAGPMMEFALAASDQLMDPAQYIRAVLGR